MARSASVTSPAFLFVMTTGIVNLFGDITYEGGASINGPFMASLGASAAIVSITAGHLCQCAFRLVCCNMRMIRPVRKGFQEW